MLAYTLVDPVISPRSCDLQSIPQPEHDLPRQFARPFECRSHVSTSRFSSLSPQDEEELETAEEEVEPPGPMLPHRGGRPIMVANQDNRVDGLEVALE